MRVLLQGVEGAEVTWLNFAEFDQNIMLLNDDGSLRDQSTNTVTFLLYTTRERSSAAALTLTCTAVTAASGLMKTAIVETTLSALAQGRTYYAYAKEVTAGTVTSFGNKPAIIKIG